MYQALSKKHFFRILIVLTTIYLTSACQKSPSQDKTTIKKAVLFLKNTQEKEGAWDPNQHAGNFPHKDGKIAVTALVATALLHQNKNQNKKAILQAAQFLYSEQQANGLIGQRNYANGVALYFLSLAYRKDILTDTAKLDNLIKAILEKKNPHGAWDYTDANTDRNDMSITVWFCLAFYELSLSKKYAEPATKILKEINNYLAQDSKGAGDDAPTTQALAAYTYGKTPESGAGKVVRNPGSTGQALILFIKSTIKEFAQSNWVNSAIRDQEKSIKITSQEPNKLPLCLYKTFFLCYAKDNGIPIHNQTFSWVKQQLYHFQRVDGAWEASSAPVQFGGDLMATALALTFLAKNKFY